MGRSLRLRLLLLPRTPCHSFILDAVFRHLYSCVLVLLSQCVVPPCSTRFGRLTNVLLSGPGSTLTLGTRVCARSLLRAFVALLCTHIRYPRHSHARLLENIRFGDYGTVYTRVNMDC